MANRYIPGVFAPESLLVLWAEAPMYVGGERGSGTIDLRLQRDPVTNLPVIRSTSLKGAIRSYFQILADNQDSEDGKKKYQDLIDELFGTPNKAGSVLFLDARILLFPVRSSFGHFVLVASLGNLEHLARLMKYLGNDDKANVINEFIKDASQILDKKKAVYFKGAIFDNLPPNDKEIYLLDEFVVEPMQYEKKDVLNILEELVKVDAVGYTLIMKKLKTALLVLNDELFSKVVNRGLLRVTRIRVNIHTKTVEEGALFFQELIPEYTVLVSALLKSVRAKSDLDLLKKNLNGSVIIIGGDETVGRGIARFKLFE